MARMRTRTPLPPGLYLHRGGAVVLYPAGTIGYVDGAAGEWYLRDKGRQRLTFDQNLARLGTYKTRYEAALALPAVLGYELPDGDTSKREDEASERADECEEAEEAGSDWDAVMTRAAMEHSAERDEARKPDAVMRRLQGASDVYRHRGDPVLLELLGDARDSIRGLLGEVARLQDEAQKAASGFSCAKLGDPHTKMLDELREDVERLKDAARERAERSE